MEQLIKETQTYYDRVRNTYHYVINSRKGDAGANNLSNFEMDIPAFPFPEHQGSQIVILKVNSFFICNNDKTDRLIQGFDYYERYLYYEKGDYAWPKTTTAKPHTNAKVNSNDAVNWFGAPFDDYDNAYYGGQMLSASKFDDFNP